MLRPDGKSILRPSAESASFWYQRFAKPSTPGESTSYPSACEVTLRLLRVLVQRRPRDHLAFQCPSGITSASAKRSKRCVARRNRKRAGREDAHQGLRRSIKGTCSPTTSFSKRQWTAGGRFVATSRSSKAKVCRTCRPEDLRRFAFKMATGSGKTWVIAMAIVWAQLSQETRTRAPTFHQLFNRRAERHRLPAT